MSEIPEDVMRAAANAGFAADGLGSERCEPIARAIMAERERCAKLVEYGVPVSPAVRDVGHETIIAAIRAGIKP